MLQTFCRTSSSEEPASSARLANAGMSTPVLMGSILGHDNQLAVHNWLLHYTSALAHPDAPACNNQALPLHDGSDGARSSAAFLHSHKREEVVLLPAT
jgi:hypothetical protein